MNDGFGALELHSVVSFMQKQLADRNANVVVVVWKGTVLQ